MTAIHHGFYGSSAESTFQPMFKNFLDSHDDTARRLSEPTRRSSPPGFTAILTGIVLFGSIACTQAANYFINASGALGNGSGSSASNAADASTAAKYSAIIHAQSSPGTVIVYAPGTYLVNPLSPMYSGVTHQGAGIDKTILQNPSGSVSTSSAQMWNASSGAISNFKFFDCTIDFNSINQPAYTNGIIRCSGFCFTLADHCTIQRVKFVNWGSQQQECFLIYFCLGNSQYGNMNHNLIDSCIFTQPVPTGNSHGGVTCIYMGDAQPNITVDNTNIVSNNQFLSLKYPEYSDFSYTQCCTCPVAINNYASGVDCLWMVEPGSQNNNNGRMFPSQTCQVTGNTMVHSGLIAGINVHPDTNGSFGSLNVQNNSASLDQHPYQSFGLRGPQFVEIQTAGGSGTSQIGAITVQNNIVTAPPAPWTANPALVWANSTTPSLFHVNTLTVINNQMIGFPGDGSEIQVNWGEVGSYTKTGSTFRTGTTNTGPYNGTPAPIPGNVFASNYDLGGQSVGYQDTTGGNPGVYRTDGVDIKASSDTNAGTGYVLGWRTTGEWTNYTVNVAKTGQYTVTARVESAFSTGKFHVSVDGTTVFSVTVPLTGPWDTASSWTTLNLGTVALTSGSHAIRVYVDAPWFDLNYLAFTAAGPYKGSPAPVPGNVFASNYDLGGQSVGYQDTIGANPGVYRTDGVDIKASSDTNAGTGYVLGWRTTGEWTNYTVNVAQTSQYTVTARVESAFSTGKFHVSVDGTTVFSVTVPLTGPWDTASSWTTLNLGTVALTSGSHAIRVYVDAPWFDLNYLAFTAK